MNKLSNKTVGISAVLLLSMTATAHADNSWYISPALNYILSDSDRQADDDIGLQLGFGKQINERWNLEGSLLIDKLDFESGNGEYDQKGIMLDGLYFFNRNPQLAPYAVMGLGALRTDAGNGADTNLAANIGAGLLKQFESNGMALRGDVRYRLDDDNRSVSGQNRFGDWIVTLALNIPLSGSKQTAVPATTATVATAAPVVAEKTKASDSDKDGVIDSKDQCPNTGANVKVDSTGCEIIALEGVNFETSSAKLTKPSLVILDAAAKLLKDRGSVKVEVAGHTDSMGAATYNQDLSAKRAQAVRDYLVSKGVNAQNLSARGYGEDRPIADNATAAGRAKNRRVELRILK